LTTVLISGASIAGPALAWWLHRLGFTPVVVESAPGPRPGGHAIDVRGAALQVLRAMDLAEEAEARRTRMRGVSELDSQGNELWRSEDFTISGGSFHLDAIEILRHDLSKILVNALPKGVETIYGDSVQFISEDADGVRVLFRTGGERRFDLVVGADGLGSNIRKLVFGPHDSFIRPFHFALAPFSSPNTIGLEDWQLTYRDGAGSCTVYTAPGNESLRVSFGFAARFEDVPSDRADQIALVRKSCAHMGWKVPELLAAMEHAPDFYLGSFAQVKMPHWTRGRVALVGDAAYCPSPYTGQGTSLAIVGAHALAYELSKTLDDHVAAYLRYDRRMRPFVDLNHAIADLTRDERLADPEYYTSVVEPALEAAKDAIVLPGLV
jgi:2-polyprenyl-6-methoxyphenol hydroxylase-like FAD-dependent oxidoreductase